MIRSRNFKRESKKTLVLKIIILTGLIIITIALFFGNFRISQKRKMVARQLKRLKEEIEKISIEEEKLKAKISQAENQETLERIAREQLNLRKVGEKVVAFPMLKKEENATPTQSQTFWQKFLEKLKIK